MPNAVCHAHLLVLLLWVLLALLLLRRCCCCRCRLLLLQLSSVGCLTAIQGQVPSQQPVAAAQHSSEFGAAAAVCGTHDSRRTEHGCEGLLERLWCTRPQQHQTQLFEQADNNVRQQAQGAVSPTTTHAKCQAASVSAFYSPSVVAQ
jgi:hypothetical protein